MRVVTHAGLLGGRFGGCTAARLIFLYAGLAAGVNDTGSRSTERSLTMIKVRFGDVIGWIPGGWTRFVYDGLLYEQDELGQITLLGTFARRSMKKGAKTS